MKNEISNLKNCLTDRENSIRKLSEHLKSPQASTDARLLNEKKNGMMNIYEIFRMELSLQLNI